MNRLTSRFALLPVLALGAAGLIAPSASADSSVLATDAVTALAVTYCQADPEVPLTAEQLAPTVVGESDVEVVPGELTAHVVRLGLADGSECTVGALHRVVQLKQVTYDGTATIAGTATEFSLGNMGKSSPIDPTTEVGLAGSLVPGAEVLEDPAFEVTVTRKSLQSVPIAVNRDVKNAAAKLLKAQTKAAAALLRKQTKLAGKHHGKGADKALAAAQKSYDKRVAAAQAAYDRATAPKSVTRPVEVDYTVTGTVPRS